MLDYIWLDGKSPILNQIPNRFNFAALLLHPFVQMSLAWERDNPQNKHPHGYPSNADILAMGKPVSWSKILEKSKLRDYKELELALKSSIGALNENYVREDLAKKLSASIKTGMYYPTEDSTSVFLMNDLLKILSLKGAQDLYYSDPIFDKCGSLNIKSTNPIEICNLTDTELIITDENMNFGFFSVYDSFFTVFFSCDENINEVIQSMNFDAIICSNDTKINWYIN